MTVEKTDVNLAKFKTALEDFRKTEFIIGMARCIGSNSAMNCGSNSMPTWAGIHSLVTTKQSPEMKVGFCPVLPHPVTQYEVVRKSLTNLQMVRAQLDNQEVLPLVSDEGVFAIIADIILAEPDCFADIYPLMGGFHMQKILLRCCGSYLMGSGIEDALVEANIFEKKIVQQALAAKHYVRSVHAMLDVKDVIEKLQ